MESNKCMWVIDSHMDYDAQGWEFKANIYPNHTHNIPDSSNCSNTPRPLHGHGHGHNIGTTIVSAGSIHLD